MGSSSSSGFVGVTHTKSHGRREAEGRNPWRNQEELFIISTPIHFSSQARWPAQHAELPGSKPQPLKQPDRPSSHPGGSRMENSGNRVFKKKANTFVCLITLPAILILIDLSKPIWFRA